MTDGKKSPERKEVFINELPFIQIRQVATNKEGLITQEKSIQVNAHTVEDCRAIVYEMKKVFKL